VDAHGLDRVSRRLLAVVAALAAAAVALIVFLVVMSHSEPRRTGTNSALLPTHAVIPPGRQLCDTRVDVPAGSGAAAPWAGGYAGAHGPPATVTISSGGRLIATGRSPTSYATGIVLLRLDRTIERELIDARVCFRNRGRKLLNLYGDFSPGNRHVSAPVYADGVPVTIRLDWYGPDSRSWWDMAGTIADRFPLMKAGFLGPWALWVSLVALLAISVAAVVRVVREAAR
jgi:hypothetical protein